MVGELTMGFTTRRGFRRSLPREIADRAWEDFDQGTQRAILRLYRSAPPEVLARHGERLGELRCPALILWPADDPYIRRRSSAGATPTRSAARPSSRWSRAATGPWPRTARAARSRSGLPAGGLANLSSAVLRAVLAAVTAPPRTVPPRRRLHRARERGAPAGRPWYTRIDWWHVAPVAIAVAFAIVYLIWQPRTVDLAAHTFRADLFGEEGFTIWNGQWYGGHHTPAYSILSPPLAWLLSPPLALALAAVASRRAVRAARARRLRRGAGALGLDLVRGRHRHAAVHRPPALRARRGLRPGRAAGPPAPPLRLGGRVRRLCPLGSPVAGLFLAMAGVAFALAANGDRTKRREGVRSRRPRSSRRCSWPGPSPRAAGRPFPFTAYLPIPAFAIACLILLPRDQRALRWGAALYGIGATVALLIETPMGGNAVRLGALFGGPVDALRALGAADHAQALG